MGIREEILALGEWAQDKSWGHIYLQGLVDAADFLDKHLGELVVEHHFAEEGLIDICDGGKEATGMPKLNESWHIVDIEIFDPGDRIRIYRRRRIDGN